MCDVTTFVYILLRLFPSLSARVRLVVLVPQRLLNPVRRSNQRSYPRVMYSPSEDPCFVTEADLEELLE